MAPIYSYASMLRKAKSKGLIFIEHEIIEDLFFMLNAFTASLCSSSYPLCTRVKFHPIHLSQLFYVQYLCHSWYSPEICMRDVSITPDQTLNNSGQNKWWTSKYFSLFLSEISIYLEFMKILCQILSRYKSIWLHWSWLMTGEDLHLQFRCWPAEHSLTCFLFLNSKAW